ncbi:hypothetical protein [Paenibacillus sp. CMAA1364]
MSANSVGAPFTPKAPYFEPSSPATMQKKITEGKGEGKVRAKAELFQLDNGKWRAVNGSPLDIADNGSNKPVNAVLNLLIDLSDPAYIPNGFTDSLGGNIQLSKIQSYKAVHVVHTGMSARIVDINFSGDKAVLAGVEVGESFPHSDYGLMGGSTTKYQITYPLPFDIVYMAKLEESKEIRIGGTPSGPMVIGATADMFGQIRSKESAVASWGAFDGVSTMGYI